MTPSPNGPNGRRKTANMSGKKSLHSRLAQLEQTLGAELRDAAERQRRERIDKIMKTDPVINDLFDHMYDFGPYVGINAFGIWQKDHPEVPYSDAFRQFERERQASADEKTELIMARLSELLPDW